MLTHKILYLKKKIVKDKRGKAGGKVGLTSSTSTNNVE